MMEEMGVITANIDLSNETELIEWEKSILRTRTDHQEEDNH